MHAPCLSLSSYERQLDESRNAGSSIVFNDSLLYGAFTWLLLCTLVSTSVYLLISWMLKKGSMLLLSVSMHGELDGGLTTSFPGLFSAEERIGGEKPWERGWEA